ncbi:MAG: SUMF1/EgtB/PvdO family nonheme iron enzyme [Planctomycetes bacterium]|nr:SUMF1/EgtB/PvdO family nonheme iron enzyme [Planctomycetota bacterium]
MHPNSLLAVTRSMLPCGLLLAAACAQTAAITAQAAGSAAPTPPAAPAVAGLPTFLLPVPGGTVEIGLGADRLVQATCQVVSPARPDVAAKISASKVSLLLKQSASVLGPRKVAVEPFLLARTPVTCAQWERYLKEKSKTGPVRSPFDWWRYGREDDYTARLPEITKEFPGEELGPLLYWERHATELPYGLTDKAGKSFADRPVTFVDYREANAFAASLGMRLPTEAEWTRAARGDGNHVWPWGAGEPKNDVFTEAALEQLRILKSSDRDRKPVGTVAAAAGPFGHADMFGQVWQLVSGTGYRPINGEDPFTDEWKRLQKDKVGALLSSPPMWKDDRALAKGGSYLSGGEPITLLIDARAPMQTIDVLASVGVRLAKSLRPGYDLLLSTLRGAFNRNVFLTQQDVDLGQQVGAERYELGADGFPTAYDAISFAPVNWLSADKNPELGKLLDATQQQPLLVGVLVTTVPLAAPELPAGAYAVLFRKQGVPRELTEAVKVGHKELAAPAKKPKNGETEAAAPGKGGWREIVARYGLTEADVASKDAANGLKFVRVDGLEVPIEHDLLLLSGSDGKVAAFTQAPNHKFALGGPLAPEIAVEACAKGRMQVKLRAGAPASAANAKRVVDMRLHFTLDRPAPAAGDGWRLPGS